MRRSSSHRRPRIASAPCATLDTFVSWALASAAVLATAAPARAFHEGGTNFCSGCHLDRGAAGDRAPEGATAMLRAADASSTCLLCHGEKDGDESVLTGDGSAFTAGGDFYWLTRSFTWSAGESEGASHGHNVVAADHGLGIDVRLTTAPGGSFPAAALACTSCHDPHLKTGASYRLLAGVGYKSPHAPTTPPFTHPAPIARADPDDWTETDSNHSAYGSGMSEWCGNCHAAMLSDGFAHRHPAGARAHFTRDAAAMYNTYRKTGDRSGDQASAYVALVPFELGTADASRLDPHSRSGPEPGGEANVMCLTCHRAHASAFSSAARWSLDATFLASSHPQVGDAGVTGNDAVNAYYGRDPGAEFGQHQRQLCNKCHGMD
ncbi:MAG: cytochrome C [Deltaproteobacteria bacterium]|nr:cytochrome C [Deltaproteobacteria bacterium]